MQVTGVSKKFCRSLKKSLWYGVKDMATEVCSGRGKHDELREGEFWAVKDVSFELKRGECLALIGRNGAGKTTLLKMLNGLIKPDQGRIEMRGRVGALIALGAGFNPILTGRENIYVNGSVLGLTKKEIDTKVNDIINFAEIREFIDAPVQSYSSGMQVRLGFSVATAMEPDILILDEVLAVGDAAFRAKCYARISAVAKRAAVIFVSHNMEQVGQVCSRALVMLSGCTLFSGEIDAAIEQYNRINETSLPETEKHEHVANGVKNVFLECSTHLKYGNNLQLRLACELPLPVLSSDIKITIFEASGRVAAEAYTKFDSQAIALAEGLITLEIMVGPLFLRQGIYTVSIVLLDRSSNDHLFWGSRIRSFVANGPSFGAGDTLPPIQVAVAS